MPFKQPKNKNFAKILFLLTNKIRPSQSSYEFKMCEHMIQVK